MPTRLGSIVLVLALVFGAACSSSGSSSAPTPSVAPTSTAPPAGSGPTPTTAGGSAKASYIAAANALCDVMNQSVAALPAPGSNRAVAAADAAQTGKIVGATLRKLRALPAPAGEGPALAAIYAKVDRLLSDSARLATAIRANNQNAAKSAETDIQNDSVAANAAANAYGLTVCGA